MTLPVDLVWDVHQDGSRVRLDSYRFPGEVQITGTFGERVHVPLKQLDQLIGWLMLARFLSREAVSV